MLTDTGLSPFAKLKSLPFDAVEWTNGLYQDRFQVCARNMVPHLQNMFAQKDISHVVENFKIAAGEAEGEFDGTVFGDGDFYKWMEAAVYTAVRTKNQALLDQLEEYVALIGRAQQPDGYISTKQIIGERSHQAMRLGDINDFEVYNFGHLFTSACLYYRLTGRDSFLKIAIKAAGYLKNLYEEAKKTGNVQTAVCPSHYMGLAELYRTTKDPAFLELLKLAIALRDGVKDGLDDNQDRLPLKAHRKIIGHAVRANYLYAGVADLCMEEEDPALLEVLHAVWNSLVNTKLYIQGGCGALYNGASPYGNFFHHQLVHQAYGYEYQLPNMTAYNETCASIGGVYWAWRMFCLEKDPAYVDVMERMILNVNLAGCSLDGKTYFYENMLRRAKKLPYALVWGQERASYILSYCCPPNLARLIAQLSEYAYAWNEEGLYTVLYGASCAEVNHQDGRRIRIKQDTAYPYGGRIRFTFACTNSSEAGNRPFSLHLRIPQWMKKGSLEIQKKGDVTKTLLKGKERAYYVKVEVEDLEGTEILLDLGMEPRLTCGHPLIEETNGQVAVEWGPLVYCMEGMDMPGVGLDDVRIPSDIALHPVETEMDGHPIVALEGQFLCRKKEEKVPALEKEE